VIQIPDQPLVSAPLKVLFSEEQIQNRIQELSDEMNEIYKDTEVLVLICILKGGFMFLSDLVKRLNVPCQIEFVRLSSYGSSQKSSGTVKPVDLTLPRLNDRDVLLIEDIVDTGLTLNFFMEYLESLHTPRSLRLAVLLDKKEARQRPVETDFIGFEVGNQYVVGYGLDDQGFHRNLPYIAHYVQDES
jgi:hypoxanthine phosphoribosyltransferase